MVSVNTNISSAAAVASLRNISKLMEQNQSRIATGLKVQSAKDGAGVWSTAQTLRAESAAQSSLTAGMSKAQGQAEGTAQIVDAITEIMGKMKSVVSQGSNASADFGALNAQLAGYQAQIQTLISSASINGENWLNTAAATKTVAVSISGTSVNNATVDTQLGFLSTATNNAKGFLEGVVEDLATLTNGNVGTLNTALDTAISSATAYSIKLSGFSNTLDTMKDVQAKVEDIRQKAISSLVDADMEKESALSTALQVQQQLAYQALSIGNTSAQNILRLFQ